MATEAGATGVDLHAYCQDCEWFATPDDHDHADVWADGEEHVRSNDGHTVTTGPAASTREEARSRARHGDTEDYNGE